MYYIHIVFHKSILILQHFYLGRVPPRILKPLASVDVLNKFLPFSSRVHYMDKVNWKYERHAFYTPRTSLDTSGEKVDGVVGGLLY